MRTIICKFQWLLIAILIMPEMALSQDYIRDPQDVKNEFKSYVNYLFQRMDKSRITSGLLADYALEWVEIAPYNGIPSDTNEVGNIGHYVRAP
jgi:hypothetical protein